MDRGEPTLVPQWLKGAGRGSGISGSLPVSQTDGAGIPTLSRHRHLDSETPVRPSLNSSRKESGENRNFDRDVFGNSRAYASFRRSSSSRTRDVVRKEKDYTKERPFVSGLENDKDPYDISPSSIRFQSDRILRRTHSVVAGACLEDSSGKRGTESENGGPSTISQKASFEKRFPYLGTVGRQDKEVAVSSVSASSSSSVAFVSRGSTDTWKSALADPPAQAHQVDKPGFGLNMVEVLLQNTPVVRVSQLSAETQRIEMTLKQSRQLIPVIPGAVKPTGLGSSDGLKTKTLRATDASGTAHLAKSSGQHHLGSSSRSSAQGEGRLLILKPVKEAKSPKLDASIALHSSTCPANSCGESVGIPNWKNKQVNNSGLRVSDTGTLLKCGNGIVLGGAEEKRVVSSLAAQNRSDFFNSLRKKAASEDNNSNSSNNSNNNNGNISSSENGITPFVQKKSNNGNGLEVVGAEDVVITETVNSEEKEEDCSHSFAVGESGKGPEEVCSLKVISDEEEAAFLRLLGWEENEGGEEALTEEEISAFYQEHCGGMNSRNLLRQGKKTWNMGAALAMRVCTSD